MVQIQALHPIYPVGLIAYRFFCARMAYQVYLIENPAGRTYIGLSDDVGRRLRDHNDGVSKWTSSRGPWELKWQSTPFDTLGKARRLGNRLKRQKGGVGLQALLDLFTNESE